MAKVTLKTSQNNDSVNAFVNAVANERRRQDALSLLELFSDVTQLPAKMWGTSIIGYGRYCYRYESGREGEYFMTGFSPRKANSTIYIMPGYQDLSEMLNKLGKYKTGKCCLYINKLSDVDTNVLKDMILFGLHYLRENYETYDV